MLSPDWVRGDVYISNSGTARRYGDEFDHVITLTRDDGPDESVGSHEYTTDHIPMYDGPQTPYEVFEDAVKTTVEAIDERDGDVLVHCQAGVSRSSTVLITALAYIDDVSFDDAYVDVRDARPAIQPHPALREHARRFLDG